MGACRFAGRTRAYRRVDDRHEEAERLARSGAGRHREALPPDGFGDRLCLVAVKSDEMPVDAEDARGVGVKRAVGSEIVDRDTALEVRIDADERLRPEPIACVDLLDLRPDVRRSDLGERARKALVIVHERSIKVEYIHS